MSSETGRYTVEGGQEVTFVRYESSGAIEAGLETVVKCRARDVGQGRLLRLLQFAKWRQLLVRVGEAEYE